VDDGSVSFLSQAISQNLPNCSTTSQVKISFRNPITCDFLQLILFCAYFCMHGMCLHGVGEQGGVAMHGVAVNGVFTLDVYSLGAVVHHVVMHVIKTLKRK
jgi:hypothetical protein